MGVKQFENEVVAIEHGKIVLMNMPETFKMNVNKIDHSLPYWVSYIDNDSGIELTEIDEDGKTLFASRHMLVETEMVYYESIQDAIDGIWKLLNKIAEEQLS